MRPPIQALEVEPQVTKTRESMFNMIGGAQFADIPVMAAYLCLIALIFVMINLVVDLLYFAVDPCRA